MRLGTSGFGVIAVVSLLVTATPERIDTGKEDRGRDESSVTWPVRVVNVISRIVPTRSRFVKIEDDSQSSSLRSNTYSTIPPSSFRQPTVPPSNVRNTGTAAKLPRFLHWWSVSTRASRLARNSKRPTTSYPPDYWYTGFAVESFENGKSRRNVRSNSSTGGLATSRNFDESFAAIPGASSSSSSMDGDAPLPRLSSVLRRYARHRSRERETTSRDGDIGYEVGSTGKKNEVTGESSVESAITTYDRLTTWLTSATNKSPTSEGSSSPMSIFRDPAEHHESQIIRNLPAYESAEENVVKSGLINGTVDPLFHSSLGTMSSTAKNSGVSHYPANYQVGEQSKVRPQMKNDHRLDDRSNGDRDLKRFVDDSRIHMLTDSSVSVTSSSDKGPNGLRQEGLVHVSGNLKEHSSTVRTLNEVTLHGHETMTDFDHAEEIVRARRITDESFSDLPISEGGSAHEENVDNANGVDILIPLAGNHKAIGARSFHTTSEENEKQGNTPSGSSSLASRLPKHLGLKDNLDDEDSPVADKIETSPLAVNQIISAKSGYPNAKNNTGQSINFVDGKSKKIFYEIKPSVITDTDRVDDPQFPTTTTRQSFDKFLLSSVPSVYGKFGPYFIDEEDRRNVTERIGSTVQLDCRIGFLGDRKVTWLHHYKDSFRLLTVKKESYSVDRRISLNFQYPDNWRLQIAYASMRDSGLYKCQVEIDPDKSLVKGYNVVITAPTLTITDDSGRPVSGERHLKAGSALKLRCEARDVIPGLNESVLWMRGDETLTDDVSENRTTEIVDEREITVVISTLLVERAAPSHAGNYSCVVPDKAKTTIAVHVLNGELPAAVQHGSGVSTAVLNIWLIHLTASYGFLR